MTDQEKLWWRVLIGSLLYIGIFAIVQELWSLLETSAYGASRPRAVDTIVGLALSASLYRNLRHRIRIGGT